MENREWRVLQRIWHAGDGVYYDPGERVGLGHLSADGIERLVEQGVVELVKPARRLKSRSLEEV